MPTTSSRNDALHQSLLEATGLETKWTSDVRANLFGWLLLDHPSQLKEAAKALSGKVRLCTITAYALERDDTDKRRRIAYHFASGDTLITITVPLYDAETNAKLPIPSITPWFHNADWNEREFREMYNIDIPDHPNPKRLFLDERLDAGIMTNLIPFSAMANSAGTNMLWERILEAKGVPPEDRMPSITTPAEPIKIEPKVTPVDQVDDAAKAGKGTTLANLALSADDFADARAREKAALAEAEAAEAKAEAARREVEAAKNKVEAARAALQAVEAAAAKAAEEKAAEETAAAATAAKAASKKGESKSVTAPVEEGLPLDTDTKASADDAGKESSNASPVKPASSQAESSAPAQATAPGEDNTDAPGADAAQPVAESAAASKAVATPEAKASAVTPEAQEAPAAEPVTPGPVETSKPGARAEKAEQAAPADSKSASKAAEPATAPAKAVAKPAPAKPKASKQGGKSSAKASVKGKKR